MPKARLAAGCALHEDPEWGRAYGVLGLICLIFDFDWLSAETFMKRALELHTNEPSTLLSYAHLLISCGRIGEGLDAINTAVAGARTDQIIHASVGWIYMLAGDAEQGEKLALKALDRFPNFAPTLFLLGQIYEVQQKYDDAMKSYRHALKLETTPVALASIGHLYGIQGKRNLAYSVLRDLRELYTRKKIAYLPAYCEALVYAGLGQKTPCLDALERAFEQRCDWLMHLRVEPRWRFLRNSGRFRKLIDRVGIPIP
jgi:tetratricopeptide (TPR) repeat protein